MLLRILPDSKVPSVLFTLSFPHLPLDLPCPPSWNAYLQRLAVEELELPRDLHSLDKAAWISTILAEVTFDMTRGVVRALFIDETVQEWPLMDKTCLITLDGILKDVNLSTMDFSAPKEKAVEKPTETRPPTPSKSVKHKKQRSLLASLVALVSLPSSSSSSRCSSPPPESPAPSIRPLPSSAPCSRPSSPPASDPIVSQRILRRRARIALMDAYRRFIVSELKERLHPSGYSAWIVNSMLRRASDHMSALVEQAGGAVPDLRQFLPFPMDEGDPMGMYHEDSQQFECQTQVDEAALFDCDEESGDGRSLSTDTDGSSVHTPLHTPTSWRQNSISSWSARSDADADGEFATSSSSSGPPRSPSPPAFTQQDIDTYVGLTRQSLHLRRLLVHMDVMQKAVESDTKQLLTVLEIKSKRRAWSNRQFCGGAGMKDLGLGQPFRSSPLVLYEPIGAAGMTNSQIVRANRERRYPSASELFPMSLSPSPSNDDYEGSSVTSSPKESGLTLEVPHPRIRLRTKSIEQLKVLDQELENDMKDSRMPSPPPLPVSPPSPSRSPLPSATTTPGHGHGHPASLPFVAAPVPQKPERHMLFEPDFGMGGGRARGEMLEMPLGTMIEALDDIERDLEAGLTHGQRRYERDEWLPGIVVGER